MFDYASVTRNNETLWNYGPALNRLYQWHRQCAVVPNDFVGNILGLDILFHVRLVVMFVIGCCQSQNYQTPLLVLVAHLNQLRHLLTARSAPGGPEVQDDHFVRVI